MREWRGAKRSKRIAASVLWAVAGMAALFLVAGPGAADAAGRVALIVGNAKYEHADTLTNTVNDADAVAATLTKAGFEVVDERRNAGVVEFKRALRDFTRAVASADVAVVYYSGHGIEVGGVNYLIPVDAKLASDFDVDDETISLDRVILATQSAKKLSLIILDACRENPFLHTEAKLMAQRSVVNRMSGVEPSSPNTLVAYAAKAGSVSYDGTGANSPFTTALVKYITAPGVDIRIALGKVRDEVLASTGNRQEPFVYGSLGGDDISLVPVAPVAINPSDGADANAVIAADYQMAERVASPEGWKAFLAVHGSGYYANLARAQLAKLAGANPQGKVEPGLGAQSALSPAAGQSAKPLRDLAPPPPKAAAPAPIVAGLGKNGSCDADASALARLRLNPSAQDVKKFADELTCPDLRPQLRRFMESLGMDVPPASQEAPAADKGAADNSCEQATKELARLRASPNRAAALKFAHDLKCDDLKAQAARLVESLSE
jgi:Caspase domain